MQFGLRHYQGRWKLKLSPARQEHRQLVNSGFSLYGEAVVPLYGLDVSVTARHYLPKKCERHSQFFKHTVVNLLEFIIEGDASQTIGNMQDLSQTHPEECETPQERVRCAGVRPCPNSGAEEAQSQKGEQVEESIKAAAAHEAKEKENIGEVEHGALRGASPFLTYRVRCRYWFRREVQGFEIRRLHV